MKPHRILTHSISSFIVLGAVAAVSSLPSARAANLWDGGGTTDLWSDVFNWDNDLFPGYGTLTFAGALRTTNIVDANISMNQLLWTGTSAWTLNHANSAVISLFDNGGTQAKIENQSSGLVTINAPITFAATAGNNWGEINAVNGGLTFGTGTLTVNGTGVNGIRLFGAGQTTTFNNTVSASGKYFSTSAVNTTVEIGGAFTSGDFYLMNSGTLKLNSGGSLAASSLRLGGDFGTTGTQNLALGATFQLTSLTGGQSFAGSINSVTGNTSNALLVDSLNTSGTNTLSGSVFLDSPLRMQVAAGGTLAVTGVVSNSSSLTKQGAGTLTLANNGNTYSGGTTLNGGTLNIGATGALGSGAITVSGTSTLNNTSGAAITFGAAKQLNLNADLTFTGSNAVNLNGGFLAVGGAAGARTLNVAANTLSVDRITTGAGVTLSKTGAGNLTLTSTSNNVTSLAGVLDIQAGKVIGFSDVTVGGLTGNGTYELGGTSRWLFINGSGSQSFGGTIQNGAAALGVTKDGTGTQTVTGNLTLGSDFRVIRGGLTLSGTNSITSNANVGLATAYTDATRPTLTISGGTTSVTAQALNIGTISGGSAVLNVTGGTLTGRAANPSIHVGAAAGALGFAKISGGIVNSPGEFWVGGTGTSTSFGALTMSAGTINSGTWFVSGRSGTGVVNLNGGTLNVATNNYENGSFASALGITNISGTAAVNVNSTGTTGFLVGLTGAGILHMSGGNLTVVPASTLGLTIANGAANGIASINGGTITTSVVRRGGAGSGILNLGGGTIRANANNTGFMTGLTSANLFPGGVTFDSNGFAITVAQPLLAPTGNGLTTIPVATGGAGYIDTPAVTISGGGGTGATAIANVTGGVITSFTITSPGTGYTSAPTVTLFGGGATTAATVGTATFAANATTGGVTKTGAGTLTIASTTSTYGGPTTITGGTLSIGAVANGGAASSLGGSSNAAANLVLDGGTLQYTGATGSTDRSFSISAGKTGTIEVTNAATALTISGSTATTNGALTKTGLGTLSLTGTMNHTGLTTVSAGTLGLSGTTAGSVTVGAGQLNALYNAVGALTVPALSFAGAGGANFDFGAGNDVITIANAGGLTLGTASALNLYIAGGTSPFITNGTYTLFDYVTSYLGSLTGAFTVANSQPGKIYSIADNLGATTIELSIGDAVITNWNVDGGGSWNVSGNWTAGIPNSIGATANFGAILTAPNSPATVTVDGPKTVGNIVFSNANTYNVTGGAGDVLTLNNGLGTAIISATSGTHSVNAPIVLVNPSSLNADTGAFLGIGGDISGSAALTKTGNGTVVLSGTNSYTTTAVSAGTLQVGAGGTTGTLGSGAATLFTGTTLAVNRSNAFTLANNLSGAGGIFSQIGLGATTYTGSATHTGATNVTAGTLVNEGTINGTTALNVNGGTATLQASSNTTVAGPTTVGATASGALNILGAANATLNGLVGIGTGATFTGGLTVNTTGTVATNSIVNVGVGTGANGSFTMNAGTLNQTGATGIVIGANGGSGTYTQTGGIVNTGTGGQGFVLGIGTAGSAGTGTISGGTINAPNEFWISNNNVAGAAPTNTATLNMSAGAINAGSWFVVGRNTATGTLNLSGGTITKGGGAGTFSIIGSLGGTGTLTQTAGQFNATAGGIRLGENTGATPALALWDMSGGSSTVTGEINVGWRSSQATWNVSGSSVVNVAGRLIVAAETSNAAINAGPIVNGGPVGTVNISGGTVTISGGDSRIGGDNSAVSVGAVGAVNVSGGTLNFGGNVQFGAYGRGTLTITNNGVVNSTAGFPSIGRYVGGVGIMNVNGGTFTQSAAAARLIVGEDGTGTLNLNSGLADVQGLLIGNAATGNGTVNLNGGTLATKFVQKPVAGSTAAFKFSGGVLKTTADAADFFIGVPAASISVENGGAKIDTDTHLVTITQGLAPGAGSTGGLTKQGAGTLTLSGASTFTGATTVENGTLRIATANDRLPTGTNLTVNGGASVAGTFDLNGLNQTVGGISGASGAVAGVITSSNGPSTLTANVAGAGTFTTAANIADTGANVVSLTKLGTGMQELTGANTFTGATTVSNGTLRLNRLAADNLAIATDANTATTSDIVINGGALVLAASEQIGDLGSINMSSGSLGFSGSGLTETIDKLTVSGGTFSTGANTLLVGGATVTWSGGTNTINSGGLVSDKHWVITGGTNTVQSNALLRVQSGTGTAGLFFGGTANPTLTLDSDATDPGEILLKQDVTVDSTLTSGTAQILSAGSGALAGSIDMNGGTRTWSVNDGSASVDLLVSASITNGALTKTDLGTLKLTGANLFTGATLVSAGTLEAGAAGALGATGSVTVNAGGTLLLSGTGDRVNDSTSAFTLAGGTLNTGGLSETFGALTLSADSVIDFGGGASILTFADSSTASWVDGLSNPVTLNIWNWSGTPVTGGGVDQLRFTGNGLTATQLGQIKFYSGAGTGLITGFFGNDFVGSFGEVVPVPEPSSVATVMGLLGLIGWRERRKARATQAAGRAAIA